MSWMDVWTWILVLGIALFAVLAVVVGIRGFFDLRTMFRDLSAEPADDGG